MNRVSALVSSCSAIYKAYQDIVDLDSETNNANGVNFVTVDYDGNDGNTGGGFICTKGRGGFALDYKSCRVAAHGFNAGFVFGDVVGELGIQGYGAIKNASDQGKVQQTALSGEIGAQQTASFEAVQRQQFLQRDQQIARAGIQAAKSATSVAIMTNYVTAKKVRNDWCGSGGANSDSENSLNQAESCAVALMYHDSANNPDNRLNQEGMRQLFFPNGHVTGKLGQNAASSFAQALVAGVIAKLHDKQGKSVGQVKDEFVNANFNQDQTGISRADLPTFCSENPTAPSCRTATSTSNGGQGFQIDFGNGIGGSPNEISFNNEDLLTDDEIRELTNATREGTDLIPDLTNGISGDRGDSDLTAIAPGDVSSSKRSGGGGGGGSAGGGGGGGGAGPDPSQKQASASAGELGKRTGVKYSGGSTGSYSSGSSAKKKTSSNPFDNITRKKSNRTVASEVEKNLLPKDIKLFEAISKRYTEVSSSGRLENIK